MDRNRRLIAVILLGLAVLLNLPAPKAAKLKGGVRDNIAPYQNFLSLFTTGFGEFLSNLVTASHETKLQREMLEELTELRLQVRDLMSLKYDNEELRRSLSFTERQGRDLIMCQVVLRGDASGWWETVRINRGLADGVNTNMAVISVDGLVGRTIEVSSHTSEVLLITDSRSRVAAKVYRTGSLGIMKGSYPWKRKKDVLDIVFAPGPCRIDYLSKGERIFEGDEVVTSGLGGAFPEGLLVGKVSDVTMDESGLYQEGEVVPVAELGCLRYVFVVLP